jgi:hypothetical protein
MVNKRVSQALFYILALLILAGLGSLSAGNVDSSSSQSSEPASSTSDGTFFETGQSLGLATSRAVALGDLDGDNDLDAFVANDGANRVWLNNGSAWFSGNGQALGDADSQDVALADLDGDGDLDAYVANGLDGAQPDKIWLNDGDGQFVDSGQTLGNAEGRGVALGDVDGDDDLDAFVATGSGNVVWLNDGDGAFSDSGQDLGTSNSYDVALADLDGDDDLDAFVSNGLSGGQPDTVWLNDGDGQFTDSGQTLGSAWSYGVALENVDGDSDVDAFSASWFPHANKVWLNDGSGQFTDSGQSLGDAASLSVSLGNVDGDSDVDAVVANNTPDAIKVWLNDGSGQLTDSGQTLGDTTTYDVGLGDVDGDGDLDIFAANFGANKVWLNGPPGLPEATFDVERTQNDEGLDVTYWASENDATLPVLLGRPATQETDVHVQIDTATGTFTDVLSFAPDEQLKLLQVVNPAPDPSEEADLTLSVTPAGAAPDPGDVTDTLRLVFVDGEQGMKGCILCYVEWLGRLVGLDSTFGAMHHVDLPEQEASPQWDYYTALFDLYAPEMSDIVAARPSLLWLSIDTFDEWQSVAQSLDESSGDSYVVSQDLVDNTQDLLDGVEANAGPGLKAALQQERQALDLASVGGMTADEGWEALQERRPITQAYLTMVLR